MSENDKDSMVRFNTDIKRRFDLARGGESANSYMNRILPPTEDLRTMEEIQLSLDKVRASLDQKVIQRNEEQFKAYLDSLPKAEDVQEARNLLENMFETAQKKRER